MEKLTVPCLKKHARANGVEIPRGALKRDIIVELRKHVDDDTILRQEEEEKTRRIEEEKARIQHREEQRMLFAQQEAERNARINKLIEGHPEIVDYVESQLSNLRDELRDEFSLYYKRDFDF
jgi:hypothetical protein